ncbi:5'-adenylylsulfate reductase-like 3 [Elaeis guineensis]|uniref:5'-adenylylsulfate reductase-like 3 n=1 Tax=Elaeis guineensis var. tenera TaxID=51953 RepID=A0A6I9SD40_ELAGV|nr:5'-adenylylsulfate reductase-like 3 [Elaeis guineensis]
MEGRRVWRAGAALLVLLLVVVGPAAAAASVCPRVSASESILGRPDSCSALESPVLGGDLIGVVEGDEAILQRALNLVYSKREDYVAVLFYASWCPFSKICRPNFQVLSSLFPTIRHFAFEESVIRPSMLSRYGVHGFPTLFLLNSTMRVRYHGSRTINSLVAFYNDVTGANPALLDPIPVEKIVDPSNDNGLKEDNGQENCPFSGARSPEKLLQQDTYLVLASSFVLMRLLCILLPKLNACVKRAWRRHMQYASLMSLQDRSQAYVDHVKQGFNRLNPCKRGNLQEGAMNARAWASKSLASVSIGEPSSGRAYSGGDRR